MSQTIYKWYNVFSLPDFVASALVSRTYTVFLDGIGRKDIIATNGNVLAITYEDTFLPLQFNDENPYARSPYAVFVDDDENVWLGIEVEE